MSSGLRMLFIAISTPAKRSREKKNNDIVCIVEKQYTGTQSIKYHEEKE